MSVCASSKRWAQTIPGWIKRYLAHPFDVFFDDFLRFTETNLCVNMILGDFLIVIRFLFVHYALYLHLYEYCGYLFVRWNATGYCVLYDVNSMIND